MQPVSNSTSQQKVWLFVPNLIGYGRAVLLFASAVLHPTRPLLAYILLLANFVSDGLDGYFARKLQQVSRFGAFLDVVVDNASRGYLWTLSCPPPWGFAVTFLECTTFACTHASSSTTWKGDMTQRSPWWVSRVMANGMWNPLGVLVGYGLFGCPLWMYAHRFLPGTVFSHLAVGVPAMFGRLLAAAVELWVCCAHMSSMLSHDSRDSVAPVPASAASKEE